MKTSRMKFEKTCIDFSDLNTCSVYMQKACVSSIVKALVLKTSGIAVHRVDGIKVLILCSNFDNIDILDERIIQY